jgi:CspA family cold shock protein
MKVTARLIPGLSAAAHRQASAPDMREPVPAVTGRARRFEHAGALPHVRGFAMGRWLAILADVASPPFWRVRVVGRDDGRVRRSRGRSGLAEDTFGGGPDQLPQPDFSRFQARPSGAGFGQESEATVKWFKPDKGFGFVEVANGGGDAFLHASVLERVGTNAVEAGAVLRVRTGQGQKGLQVTEVLEIVAGTSPPRSARGGDYQPRMDATSSQGEGEEVQGVVKWYNADKGFGFVSTSDGGKDVFVHATALERSGIRTLTDGQSVRLRVVQGRKGPEVSTISAE